MYRTRKLFNILVTLDKNFVREVLGVKDSILANFLNNLGDNYIDGNELGQF